MDYEPQQQTDPNGQQLAQQACASCRKQKRRCDKQLPACALCLRIGRICDYSPDSQPVAPSPEDFAALRQQVADLEHLLRSNSAGAAVHSNASNGSHSSNGTSNNDPSLLSNAASPLGILSPNNQAVWPGPTSFPSLFFLDSNAFEYERFQFQTLESLISI